MWDFVGQVFAECIGDRLLKSLGVRLTTGGALTYLLLCLFAVAVVIVYALGTNFSPFSLVALIAVGGIMVLFGWQVFRATRREL